VENHHPIEKPVDRDLVKSQADGIVHAMTGLLRRRTVRHLAIAITPLLVIGIVLLVVLLGRFGDAAAPIRAATAEAQATVTNAGLGEDAKEVELTWADAGGGRHVNRVRVPEVSNVRTGGQVTIKYVPSDPDRIVVNGDEATVRVRDLAFGIFVTIGVLLAAVVVTIVHLVRRLSAERRPVTMLPVSYARSKRGLLQRSWLVVEDGGADWWVPVHWDRAVSSAVIRKSAAVHGRPSAHRVTVIDIDGTPVWQSGRRRAAEPAGDLVRPTAPKSAADKRVAETEAVAPAGLARQFRVDAALVVVAPLLGLLWAYVDGTGTGGFVASSLLMLGVLTWLPAVVGSDPT
jgi:hypothetical protein